MVLPRNQKSKQHIDKETFKLIFRDHWNAFKLAYPTYNNSYYDQIIQKMLDCGDSEKMGYVQYRCFYCGESRTIAFSCKSTFCLSCAKGYTDKWVEFISRRLIPNVTYRHIVLTIPDSLRKYFKNDSDLLSELMRTAHRCLKDTIAYLTNEDADTLNIGSIIVLQTFGRAANHNPHLHILVTAGGLNELDQWVKCKHIPFSLLNKKWQYHLLTMLRNNVDDPQVKDDINYYWNMYEKGFVTHIQKGNVPKGGKGIAQYLAKYLVSPPISVRRIEDYDGQSVSYWYHDHKTNDIKHEALPVLEFIERMVMHILPKNFHRIRYYGLHSNPHYQQARNKLSDILRFENNDDPNAYRVMPRKPFAQLFFDWFGKSPFICPQCGEMMDIELIYHPTYGTIADFTDNYLGPEYDPTKDNLAESRKNAEGIRKKQSSKQLSLLPLPDV